MKILVIFKISQSFLRACNTNFLTILLDSSELLNFDVQERSRSHSIPVVHLPPLSTIVRPQFNGKQ